MEEEGPITLVLKRELADTLAEVLIAELSVDRLWEGKTPMPMERRRQLMIILGLLLPPPTV